MDETVAISIIIPVYNTERYLEECLQSVKNQTYKSYEVICIDDGSSDGSRNILSKYEDESNFHIIYQNNHGVSHARNVGLSLAKGKYIFFMDSDDIITNNCLSLLSKDDISCYGMVCAGLAEMCLSAGGGMMSFRHVIWRMVK